MKADKRITSFEDHLDEQYGKVGTEFHDKFQKEFETVKISMPIGYQKTANWFNKNELMKLKFKKDTLVGKNISFGQKNDFRGAKTPGGYFRGQTRPFAPYQLWLSSY